MLWLDHRSRYVCMLSLCALIYHRTNSLLWVMRLRGSSRWWKIIIKCLLPSHRWKILTFLLLPQFCAPLFGCLSLSWRINCFSSRILLLDVDDDMSTALSALPCLLCSVCVYWMLWRKLISFIRERCRWWRRRIFIEWSRDDVDVVFYEKGGKKKIVVISSGIWDDDESIHHCSGLNEKFCAHETLEWLIEFHEWLHKKSFRIYSEKHSIVSPLLLAAAAEMLWVWNYLSLLCLIPSLPPSSRSLACFIIVSIFPPYHLWFDLFVAAFLMLLLAAKSMMMMMISIVKLKHIEMEAQHDEKWERWGKTFSNSEFWFRFSPPSQASLFTLFIFTVSNLLRSGMCCYWIDELKVEAERTYHISS